MIKNIITSLLLLCANFASFASAGVITYNSPGVECSAAIQQVIDTAPANSTIYFPDTYIISNSIFVDKPNITLKGDSGTAFNVYGYNPVDAFVVGLPRVNSGGNSINASYVYQNPANPGQYGLRTNGNSFVQSQFAPSMFGAASPKGFPQYSYWGNQQLCIDVSFAPDPALAWQPSTFLFGSGDANNTYTSYPFTFWTGADGKSILFCFRTNDITNNLLSDHQVYIPLTGLTPPYNLRVSLDLAKGTCVVNNCSVNPPAPVVTLFTPSPGATKPFTQGGLNFTPNYIYPFMVGLKGLRTNLGATTPLILYGFKASNAVPASFAPNTSDNNTIFYFPAFTPTNVGRVVSIGTGPLQGSFSGNAYFLQTQGNGNAFDNIKFDGININCATAKGVGILIGSVINFNIANSRIENGAQAIANLNWGANYPVWVRVCRLQGFDCAYYGSYTIFRGSEITIDGGGADTFRFLASDVVLKDVFSVGAAANANTFINCFSGDYGGSYWFEQILSDNEGASYGTAGVRLEQHAYAPTQLKLKNVNLGMANAVPAVILQRMSPTNSTTWLPCKLMIEGMIFSQFSPAFRVLGGPGGTQDHVVHDGGGYNLDTTYFTW